MRITRPSSRRAAAVTVAVAALLLGGCASKGGTAAGNLGTLTGTGSPTVNPTPGATATPTPTTGSTSATTGTSTSKGSGSSDPQIVDFSVKQQPICPVIGTSDAPFSAPGTDIILQWKVTHATGVALSLDDPKFYDTYHTGSISTYGTSGTVDLAFQCDDITQPTTVHTYTLDTIGSKDIRKTITVSKQTSP